MEIITYEYLPYIEQVTYVKYEIIYDKQVVDGFAKREYVWGKWSYSSSSSGPWTEFRYQLFAGMNRV